MEKQKRWQLYLILAVLVLTLYNILPTIFYYTKPLKAPIESTRAEKIAETIVERVNDLENESKEWLVSFSRLLGIKPISIQQKDAGLFEVSFANAKEAELFKRFLPRAGLLIPFVPAQLELYSQSPNEHQKVLVSRQIKVHLEPADISKQFQFSPKYDADGQLTPAYRNIVYDRVAQLALSLGGPSREALQLAAIAENPANSQYDEMVLSIAKDLLEVENAFGVNSPITKRYFERFSQSNRNDAQSLIPKFIARAETLKLNLTAQKDKLLQEQKSLKAEGELADSSKEERITLLESQRKTLESAIASIQKNTARFKGSNKSLDEKAIQSALEQGSKKIDSQDKLQILDLGNRNPYISSLIIDWGNNKILFKFHPEIEEIRSSTINNEEQNFLKDRLNQFVINEIARASQSSDETIVPDGDSFAINLSNLTNSQSMLTFNLGYLAEKHSEEITEQLRQTWQPITSDLNREAYPILSYEQYKALKPEEQRLGLVVYAPAMYKEAPPMGFRTGSIYVIARGMDAIKQKHTEATSDEKNQGISAEVADLNNILQRQGFIGYPGSSLGIDPAYRKDYIYELDDYYSNLLKASREDFVVKGSKRFAILDFTDVEQRILTLNKIDDRIQEDLLKWKEEYNVAQVSLDATNKYLVPAPTSNPYWSNFKLSFVKYFRGDDRKVLKWGLDLSGGKTVRIGLRDRNNRPVTNPEDIKQAVNELYTRVNNMGVSERTIHIENNNIILDFPGSQNLSAAELIKASAMYFHIVNEKFGMSNPNLRDATNQFLQSIWNEAVVTNRKDIDSINAIAWQHLGGNSNEAANMRPISDYAKELYAKGLRLVNPKDGGSDNTFNDSLSSVAMLKGDDITEWGGQSHPLLIVFHNYALEGANLTNVQVGYDPMQGNVLTFGVKRSYDNSKGSGSPRDDFYAWTSQFAEDKISGTQKEGYSQGHGWRMAVILNGKVISSPVLRAALRDAATISGHFSQREITQLAADLKAGSLSFTPRILSEQNVSPELGREERTQGIAASLIALILVVIAMVGYYRFAGVVASCAVIFNILIMWGVLQNLGAALTLPGIAGIVLTIGMAVDANVLVFERIREEFSLSGRIASAIQAGYRKAFSAIVDSNITTIIAALILIQFDSGPIKGFAVTLIIGILSSMFTALFMTRYFFAGWVQNPKNKSLKMAQFITNTHFDFLAHSKKVILGSLILMLLGSYFFVAQRKTLFGMDFTGGYSLNIELVEQPTINESYRIRAMNALLSHGATSNDVQIRELSKPNQLRIQLGTGIEEKGHPFYQMPESLQDGKFAYEYEKNPRIIWVVNALNEDGLQIAPSQLAHLESNWTLISGQLSDTMRNNALIALGIALLSILIYITFRFEFKYAISAVVGLVHDVLITIGILAMFNWLGFPAQIDLQVIGAIMTIIGYSLNDTIIVFDRIREDLHIMRKMSYKDIINHALNVTLSRTLMTSGTTLVVLLTLVILGGKSIFAFSLVMTIGVLVGTASSLFIASPMLLYLHNREVREQELKRASR